MTDLDEIWDYVRQCADAIAAGDTSPATKRAALERLHFRVATRLRSPEPSEDTLDYGFFRTLYNLSRESHAQLFQDVWALHKTGEAKDRYFVEIGAGDGIYLSNTYLLERQFGWSGLIVEPNPAFRERLAAERKCTISNVCVFARTGETVIFRCTQEGEYSGILDYAMKDFNTALHRSNNFTDIPIETVSINDLLENNNAPAKIDYLSVDTEGSELEILSSLDFDRWDVRAITVEHNWSEHQSGIHQLLTAKGYTREFEYFSLWDAWYTKTLT